MELLKFVIIEDHLLIREMWSAFLTNNSFTVTGESGEFTEGLEQVKLSRPDFVLLDINLNSQNGIDMIPYIRKHSPGTNVIIVSMHTQPAIVRTAFRLGAKGYITKNSSGQEILNAVKSIQNGENYLCDEIQYLRNNSTDENLNGLELLSLREIEIVKLIKAGNATKEIAEKLFISPRTVETHRANILKKLKLHNTAALLAFLQYCDIG
ncbi:MAG: response regulator transcription factor [Bacteroidetes bacterium]|nr:response regulator transcription factor [Bacteroidota bacterium]